MNYIGSYRRFRFPLRKLSAKTTQTSLVAVTCMSCICIDGHAPSEISSANIIDFIDLKKCLTKAFRVENRI